MNAGSFNDRQPDPACLESRPNPFGGEISVLRVPASRRTVMSQGCEVFGSHAEGVLKVFITP